MSDAWQQHSARPRRESVLPLMSLHLRVAKALDYASPSVERGLVYFLTRVRGRTREFSCLLWLTSDVRGMTIVSSD